MAGGNPDGWGAQWLADCAYVSSRSANSPANPLPAPPKTQVVQQAGITGQRKGAKGAHSQARTLHVKRLLGVVPSIAPGAFSGERFPPPPRHWGTSGRHPATVRTAPCEADPISYWGEEAQREGAQGAQRALPLFRRYLSGTRASPTSRWWGPWQLRWPSRPLHVTGPARALAASSPGASGRAQREFVPKAGTPPFPPPPGARESASHPPQQ